MEKQNKNEDIMVFLEKKNRVPYIEQQDFGGHNKCWGMENS